MRLWFLCKRYESTGLIAFRLDGLGGNDKTESMEVNNVDRQGSFIDHNGLSQGKASMWDFKQQEALKSYRPIHWVEYASA